MTKVSPNTRILNYKLCFQMFCSSNCALLRRAISESAALFKTDQTQVSSEDIVFRLVQGLHLGPSTTAGDFPIFIAFSAILTQHLNCVLCHP